MSAIQPRHIQTPADFAIAGLDPAGFSTLFDLSDAELSARSILRRRVQGPQDAFPCRVSLRFARKGEEVLLLPYCHQSTETSPYRASGPIFVTREAARFRGRGVLPEILMVRTMSVRAYDAADILIDAEIADGIALGDLVNTWLKRPEIAYLHVHFARQGCFACRIDRN